MIVSWKSLELIDVLAGRVPKGFQPDMAKRVRRVLAQLNAAVTIEDMATPPGNRLHKLTGDKEGLWAVRVNDQFRITFVWDGRQAADVWFGDYH